MHTTPTLFSCADTSHLPYSFTLFTHKGFSVFTLIVQQTTFPESETSTPKHERKPVPQEAPPSYDDVIDRKGKDAATGSELKAGEYQYNNINI